jgi:phosphoribosylformylglycinamidine synthase
VVRIDEETGLGVAISTDANGRFTYLDPYAGAQLALAEAYRNVAATGARPLAVTDCLNFGSPEDPGVMWQFAEAVRGLADGCQALGVPVTGGNVSFYNQTGATPILPTPDAVLLLGETRVELDGSEWAHVVHGHLGGVPPRVDLEAERALAGLLVAAAEAGLLVSAHDLSDGGLAQGLVECCLRRNVGAGVKLGQDWDPFVELFSESAARAVVSVAPANIGVFTALAAEHLVPAVRIGIVGGSALVVSGARGAGGFTIGLDELRAAHGATFPAAFD